VGSDIESLCSKCGDVWHVIIAIADDKIAKVECKECHGVHRYKDPQAKKKAAAKRKTARAQKAAKQAEADLPVIEADASKPVRKYKTGEAFEPGERISHPKFGEGVAQRSVGPGRIEIMFDGERKVLAQAKPESKLERGPRPRRIATEAE
jgi:hypothetical protein